MFDEKTGNIWSFDSPEAQIVPIVDRLSPEELFQLRMDLLVFEANGLEDLIILNEERWTVK